MYFKLNEGSMSEIGSNVRERDWVVFVFETYFVVCSVCKNNRAIRGKKMKDFVVFVDFFLPLPHVATLLVTMLLLNFFYQISLPLVHHRPPTLSLLFFFF